MTGDGPRPGRRYGLIADPHSNRQALETALAWIEERGVDAIFCLGDVVGYGGDPVACVEIVRERCAGTVRGNHDAAIVDPSLLRWFNPQARRAIERQAEILGEAEKTWLDSLPATIRLEDVALAHAGFAEPEAFDYVTSAFEADREMRGLEARWGFYAHTHVPAAFRLPPDGPVETLTLFDGDASLDGSGTYLVNPGSVGQPRDGDWRAACAVFDAATATLSWVRLAYDLEAAQAAIRRAGMPEFEAERLALGR